MAIAIANYTRHQDALSGLAAAACGNRFLFLEGPEKYGKTWLLRWLQDTVAHPARVLCFDLGAAHEFLSPGVILAACVTQLGESQFSRYARRAADLMSQPRTASIDNTTITGQHISVTATPRGETPAEQLFSAIQLTAAFVEDLAGLPAGTPPIIFAFDGFDAVVPDPAMKLINQWLDQSLLPGLMRAACTRVVIAGRTVPAVQGKAWSTSAVGIRLEGVRDSLEWMKVVAALRRGCPPKANGDLRRYVDIMVDVLQGVPGSIMTVVQNFPEESTGG